MADGVKGLLRSRRDILVTWAWRREELSCSRERHFGGSEFGEGADWTERDCWKL